MRRVILVRPDGSHATAPVWATVEEEPDGTALVLPKHRYPDVVPETGWSVLIDDLPWRVTDVGATGALFCLPEVPNG